MNTTDIPALAGLLTSERLTRTRLADGSGVILHLDELEVLTLNETGQFLVELLADGVDTLEGLALALADEFEVELETARRDAAVFVEELAGHLRSALSGEGGPRPG